MGHKSAQVLFKFILFSCLAASLSWLISGQKVLADNTTSAIVKLTNGTDIASVAADHNAVLAESIPAMGIFLLESNDTDFHNQLLSDDRITAVYENLVIEGQPRYAGLVGQELEAQPWESGNDPGTAYSEQWAINNVRLTKAHDISQGEGILVAILDSGIDLDHELFQGRLVDGYDFVDNDTVPAEMRDGIDQDGDISVDEGAGHGTHVAGIIALTAPQAKIMPVRIFDDEGRGLYFDMVAGFIYAVDNGADVINLSGSGPEDTDFLADAIAYAEAHDVVVVAAGGVNSLGYPASYSSVISVGATDEQDYPTDFSNFSGLVNTVYAPGLSIISGYDDGSYAVWTGNSMATPFVSGTAALLMATETCDATCVKATILDTAHPVVDDPETPDYYGRIDTFDAVSAAANQNHVDMSVMMMDGDLGTKVGDQQIKPYFNIVNKGNSLPLSEVTLRYWFARDGDSSQTVECDYAAVQCNMLIGETVNTTETAVADSYLELSFAPDSGILLGNHDTGKIQLRIHKTDWQMYDELNDYSFNGATAFTETQQVTLYHNGQLIWGEEPAGSEPMPTPQPTSPPSTPAPTNTPMPTSTPAPTNTSMPTNTPAPTNTVAPDPTTVPPTATALPTQSPTMPPPSPEPTDAAPASGDIRVQYRSFDSDPYNNNLQPHLQLVNDGSSAIPLSEMRVRYWFTDAATAVSVAHCDYAAIGNDKITAVAGSTGTQHYIDVTFSQAAGVLNAGSSTGAIYLRIHHDNWTPYDENDDYSFSLAQVDFIDWQNVTLYHNDQLIWGVEP